MQIKYETLKRIVADMGADNVPSSAVVNLSIEEYLQHDHNYVGLLVDALEDDTVIFQAEYPAD